MTSPGPVFATEYGPVQCARLDDKEIHHVGYEPEPWNWAGWEYATGGHFEGRWDDPTGHWRAKYVGADPVACYLEVLAPFRPDPALQTDMDVIDADEEDDEYPTILPGKLEQSWCQGRLFCTARLSGCFALPSHHETLPTLREQFLPMARDLQLTDVDGAAVRDGKRELTQSMSAWIYEIVGAGGERISGVEYLSRHGDGLTLWAIYERGAADSPPEITAQLEPAVISPDDEALSEAMRIHRIEWLTAT